MGRHDWYRNEEWNDEIADAFFAKLKRAQQKNQYLRIQALYLEFSHPEVALDLLDKYFKLDGDFFDSATAFTQRAEILLRKNNIEGAIIAYENALKQEASNENYHTEAAIMLPLLFVEHNLLPYFKKGIEILEANKEYVPVPVNRFRWHAAMAIFKNSLGENNEASKHAKIALDAATEEKSGFWYHQKLGLVSKKYEPIIEKLRKICT
jgi:tetratricopeptide (TPR) repeat protein